MHLKQGLDLCTIQQIGIRGYHYVFKLYVLFIHYHGSCTSKIHTVKYQNCKLTADIMLLYTVLSESSFKLVWTLVTVLLAQPQYWLKTSRIGKCKNLDHKFIHLSDSEQQPFIFWSTTNKQNCNNKSRRNLDLTYVQQSLK